MSTETSEIDIGLADEVRIKSVGRPDEERIRVPVVWRGMVEAMGEKGETPRETGVIQMKETRKVIGEQEEALKFAQAEYNQITEQWGKVEQISDLSSKGLRSDLKAEDVLDLAKQRGMAAEDLIEAQTGLGNLREMAELTRQLAEGLGLKSRLTAEDARDLITDLRDFGEIAVKARRYKNAEDRAEAWRRLITSNRSPEKIRQRIERHFGDEPNQAKELLTFTVENFAGEVDDKGEVTKSGLFDLRRLLDTGLKRPRARETVTGMIEEICGSTKDARTLIETYRKTAKDDKDEALKALLTAVEQHPELKMLRALRGKTGEEAYSVLDDSGFLRELGLGLVDSRLRVLLGLDFVGKEDLYPEGELRLRAGQRAMLNYMLGDEIVLPVPPDLRPGAGSRPGAAGPGEVPAPEAVAVPVTRPEKAKAGSADMEARKAKILERLQEARKATA